MISPRTRSLAEELAPVVLVKVESDAGLVVVVGTDNGGGIYKRTHIPIGIESGRVDGNLIEVHGGYLVIGIGDAAGSEVDEWMADAGEIAPLLGGGRHGRRGRCVLFFAAVLESIQTSDIFGRGVAAVHGLRRRLDGLQG
jgi:hypothetical protein